MNDKLIVCRMKEILKPKEFARELEALKFALSIPNHDVLSMRQGCKLLCNDLSSHCPYKTNSVAFIPQTNYTDLAATAFHLS
jgi:hypothetical protein